MFDEAYLEYLVKEVLQITSTKPTLCFEITNLEFFLAFVKSFEDRPDIPLTFQRGPMDFLLTSQCLLSSNTCFLNFAIGQPLIRHLASTFEDRLHCFIDSALMIKKTQQFRSTNKSKVECSFVVIVTGEKLHILQIRVDDRQPMYAASMHLIDGEASQMFEQVEPEEKQTLWDAFPLEPFTDFGFSLRTPLLSENHDHLHTLIGMMSTLDMKEDIEIRSIRNHDQRTLLMFKSDQTKFFMETPGSPDGQPCCQQFYGPGFAMFAKALAFMKKVAALGPAQVKMALGSSAPLSVTLESATLGIKNQWVVTQKQLDNVEQEHKHNMDLGDSEDEYVDV